MSNVLTTNVPTPFTRCARHPGLNPLRFVSDKAPALAALLTLCLPLTMNRPACAQGGSYVLQSNGNGGYSGGQWTASSSTGPTTTIPYTYYSPPAQDYGGIGNSYVNGPASVSLSGTGNIGAAFVWSPAITGTPPPSSAVIWQHCTESFMDNAVSGVTVTYNAGGGAGSTVGDRYTAQNNPGTSFSLAAGDAMDPTISATGTVAAGQSGGLNATLLYTAAAYPVTISLGGTTLVNGAQEALTGQQITATVVGLPTFPSGTQVSYQWSVNGASGINPFKTWDPNAPGDTYYPTQLVALAPNDYTLPTGTFYFYDEHSDAVTASCTVTITTPNSNTLTVTATSQSLTFIKPTVTQWGVTILHIWVNRQRLELLEDQDGNLNLAANEFWDPIEITVPSPFNVGSQGQGGLCQTIVSANYWNFRHPTGTGASQVHSTNPESKQRWHLGASTEWLGRNLPTQLRLRH